MLRLNSSSLACIALFKARPRSEAIYGHLTQRANLNFAHCGEALATVRSACLARCRLVYRDVR